ANGIAGSKYPNDLPVPVGPSTQIMRSPLTLVVYSPAWVFATSPIISRCERRRTKPVRADTRCSASRTVCLTASDKPACPSGATLSAGWLMKFAPKLFLEVPGSTVQRHFQQALRIVRDRIFVRQDRVIVIAGHVGLLPVAIERLLI